MMKKQLYPILFALFTLTFFTGCGKDDDPGPVTKTDMLVAHEWRGDQVMVNGIDVSTRPEVTGQIGEIKTVRLKFEEDGTYNATFTSALGPQTQAGNWSFNEDETKLTFELYGETDVKTLTENNLDLTAKIPFQGVMFNAEVMFVK